MMHIVIPRAAPNVVNFAAEELKSYLEILTKNDFYIGIEKPPVGTSAIFLGKNAFYETPRHFGSECFGIYLTPVSASGINRHIRIVGDDKDYGGGNYFPGFDPRRSRKGTLFGVYALLEMLFGVRWYWPGQSGEIFTMNHSQSVQMLNKLINSSDYITGFSSRTDTVYAKEFGVTELEHCEYPKFSWRHLYLVPELNINEEIWKWYMRLRLGINIGSPYSFQHTERLHDLLNTKFDDCNSCYGLVNNERKESNQVCTSNPLVKQKIVDSLANEAIKHGADNILSVSADEGKRYCEDDECRSLDHPDLYGEEEGDRGLVMTDRILSFVNELFSTVTNTNPKPLEIQFPDLKLGLLSYHETKPEPRTLLWLHPNIVISFTQFLSFYNDPIEKVVTRNRLQNWLRKAQHLVIREYIGQLSFGNIFVPQCDAIVEEIHHINEFQQIMGFYSETSIADLTINYMNYYLLAKLLWDPGITDKEISEYKKVYFSDCYAEAGPLISDFYRDIELKFMSRPIGSLPLMEGIDEWLDNNTIKYWLTELNKAKSTVSDANAKVRLDVLLAAFDYTVALRKFFAAYKKLIGLGYPLNASVNIKRKEIDFDSKVNLVDLKTVKDAITNVKNSRGELLNNIKSITSINNTYMPEGAFYQVNGQKIKKNDEVVAGVTTWVNDDLNANDYSQYSDTANPEIIYQVPQDPQVVNSQKWQDWKNSFVDKRPVAGAPDVKIENDNLYIRVGGLIETSPAKWTTYKYHYQWIKEWILKKDSTSYVELNSKDLYYFEMIYKVDNLHSSRWESESENPELAFVKKPTIPQVRLNPCKPNPAGPGLLRLGNNYWVSSGFPPQQQWGKWLVLRQLFTVPVDTKHLIISMFLNAKGEYWVKKFKVVKIA